MKAKKVKIKKQRKVDIIGFVLLTFFLSLFYGMAFYEKFGKPVTVLCVIGSVLLIIGFSLTQIVPAPYQFLGFIIFFIIFWIVVGLFILYEKFR